MDTGSPPVVDPRRRERWWTDAALYAGSALVAWAALAASDLPLHRSWGRVAVWVYAGGAAVAPLASRGSAARRVLLAVAVGAGATLVPLASAVATRGDGGTGDAAQSEVFVVEEGARSLLEGRDPYAEVFAGPLASRPDATRSHVPYPPAMLVFGLPSATAGPGPATDARVWFLLGSLAVAIPAIRAMRTDAEGRLRSFQVLFVLPTGALLLATGGHDVPVLATLLAAFVLADRRRAGPAGVVSGVALAMRQTSVLAIPFVLTILPPRDRVRALLAGAGVASLAALPFLLWDPGAFIEDVVLFPLGLGAGRSSARTPTLGSVLIDLAPGSRTPIAIGLVAVILASVVLLVTVRRPRTTAGASARAAVAFAIAIALAPAARFGYVVYPVSLAVWALAFRAGAETGSKEPTGPLAATPQ